MSDNTQNHTAPRWGPQCGNITVIGFDPALLGNASSLYASGMNLVSQIQDSTYNMHHVNVRNVQPQMVRYPSPASRCWGHQARLPSPSRVHHQPINLMEPRCLHGPFVVAVNDGPFHCQRFHQQPPLMIEVVGVQQLQRTVRIAPDIRRGGNFSSSHPPSSLISHFSSRRLAMYVSHPILPFFAPIDGKLGVDNEIQVHGQVKPCCSDDGFFVNLLRTRPQHSSSTIALHLHLRYQGGSPPIVAMDSWINSCWGVEEQTSSPSLVPGSFFVLVIKCLAGHYEISVNGAHLANYAHRVSAYDVDSVAIDGDLIVNRVIAI